MYIKNYKVQKEHIDFQGIVDGLYVPFYMEWCRHAFIQEVLGINMEEEAKKGNMYVLTEYTLKFKKSLREGDQMKVSCELQPNDKSSRFNVYQTITVNDKIYAIATFSITCAPQNGRPYVPDTIKRALEQI
jgi:acyl-CoA thioester hydrolase